MSRMNDLSLQRYPEAPGARRSDTSQGAAASVRIGCAAARAELFKIIARVPATADEVAAELGGSILYVRPRIAEMNKLGQIIDAGERRRNDSGRNAIVWRANL